MSTSSCCSCTTLGCLLGPALIDHLRRRVEQRLEPELRTEGWQRDRALKPALKGLRSVLQDELTSWSYALVTHPKLGSHQISWRDEERGTIIGTELEGFTLSDVLTDELTSPFVRQVLRVARRSLEHCEVHRLSHRRLNRHIVRTLLTALVDLECRYNMCTGRCQWYDPSTGKWGRECGWCVILPPSPDD